jgi:hypothetical protein
MTAAALLLAAIFPARKARSLQSPLWLTAAYALLWLAAAVALKGRLP